MIRSTSQRPTAEIETPGRSDAGYRILLIDDNPDGGLLLEHALEAEADFDFQIRHVDSVAAAAGESERVDIDVVLLDLGLAETRGLDTLRAARAALPDLPIIVLTGNDDYEVGRWAVRLGAEDYIVKGKAQVHEIGRSVRYARERHRHRQALRAMNAELEKRLDEGLGELARTRRQVGRLERMAAVGTIAAGMANELSTPLMSAIEHLWCASTREPPPDDEIRDLLAGGIEQTRRCVNTLDALLRHACEQSEVCRGDGDSSGGDVARAVERALAATQDWLHACGPSVEIDVPASVPGVVLDEASLEVVLRNLLRNACDAIEDAPAPAIRLSVRECESHVEIVVRDAGRGMVTEDRERAFEPLYTTRPGRHIGIGLTLSRRLVEAAGGRIVATDAKPVGSIFTVALPTTPDQGACFQAGI
jgi:signal transduction histidine kinase